MIVLIAGLVSLICFFLAWLTIDVQSGFIHASDDFSGLDLLGEDYSLSYVPLLASIFGLISAIVALIGILSRRSTLVISLITQFATLIAALYFVIEAPLYGEFNVVVDVTLDSSVSYAPFIVLIATLISFLMSVAVVVQELKTSNNGEEADADLQNMTWDDVLKREVEAQDKEVVTEGDNPVTFYFTASSLPIIIDTNGENHRVLKPGYSCSYGVCREGMHTFTVQYVVPGERVIRTSKLETYITRPCNFEIKMGVFGARFKLI